MTTRMEQDYPPGHPARFDYNPDTPEAREWRRLHVHPKGARDWPVDHPAAVDTPGNKNHLEVRAGVDPHHPELQAFTGRTPEQAERVRKLDAELAASAIDTPAAEPVVAPPPPPAREVASPTGQPGGN